MALIINPNAKSGSDFNQMFPHLSAKDFDDYIYNHNSNPVYARSAYFWTDGKDVFMETFLGDTNQIHECCHEYMRCHNDPIVTMLLEMEQQKNVHDEYIHSDEFIRQFGDWEKINRIEKLKKSKPLSIDGTIIINGEDVTDTINELRENPSKKNIKLLNNYVVALGKEMFHDIRLENNLSPYENPKFHINDDGKTYNFSFAGIKEASRHNLYQPGHIEGIYNIPEIIRSSIYIGTENNDDHRKPELKKFYYYALGIKLKNVDYTAKIVFTEKNNGDIYYDQSLSDIEKGKFVDLIKKEPDAVNRINRPDSIGLSAEAVHPHKKGQNSHNPYYDKRLFRICQVPQLPYLERNPLTNLWRPTEEAIELVRTNQLYVQKDGQIYNMIDNRQSILHTDKQNNKGGVPSQQYNLQKDKDFSSPSFQAVKEHTESFENKSPLTDNLKEFCNDIFYSEASNLSRDEIISKYGDTPVAIAEISKDDPVFKCIWKDAKSNLVFTGLGSFIDHWVNHHPEMESEDFLKITDVLKNPDNRYFDKIKNSVIFEKQYDSFHDIVILKKAHDKLIYERSNYLPSKLPKRWEEISRENGLPIEKSSFVDGHPTISQSDKTEAGIVRNVSTLNDNSNITHLPEKSNNPLTEPVTIYVDGKERECRNGVLEGFKNAVRRLDGIIDTNHELCDENNRLVMENIRLKEQLNKRNHNNEHDRG